MRFRTSSGDFMTSNPATLAEPIVGRSKVVSIFIVVLFPAPFGPSRPNTEPAATVKSTLLTAVKVPNRHVSAIVSMAGGILRYVSWLDEIVLESTSPTSNICASPLFDDTGRFFLNRQKDKESVGKIHQSNQARGNAQIPDHLLLEQAGYRRQQDGNLKIDYCHAECL